MTSHRTLIGMETDFDDVNLQKSKKKTLINRKLSDLFLKMDSRNRIINEFLIWFGEMEQQNWNGEQRRKA